MLSSLMKIRMVVLLSIFCTSAFAQRFGGNPASIKWKQIDTDTARIIFPAGIEPTGRRVAEVVHELQKNHQQTIGDKFQKINIVLQDQNTLSNGYVGLGPFRSEFYLFTPQNSFQLGSINWADKLALHEYRHVQQYNNFNVGIAKATGYLFGQEGRAVLNAAAVPDYFFEGDAVFNETVLSNQGRGRQPYFFRGYKSLYNEGKDYSYMKLRNGSFKDFVPDHYELGYLLVGYGIEKYGANFWKKVADDAARFKPLVYPWQGAIKKYSGITYKQFVTDAFKYYQQFWDQEKEENLQFISKKSKVRTDYKYPYVTENGLMVVLKRGYRQVPAFYYVTSNGTEQKIATRAITNDDYFSYNNNKIAYASLKPGLRWGYQEFSDIYLMDLDNGQSKKITSKERFFSPDISHDGNHFVAVEMRTNQLSNLVIMDLEGNRTFRMNGANGEVFTYPKFSTNDTLIYTAVRNAKGEMALQQINRFTSKKVNIIPFGNRLIGFPIVQGDTLFFTSSYKGSDEIWAFVQNKNAVYRVAHHSTGFYQAAYNYASNQLIASAFTADGYRLAAIKPSGLLWQKVDLNENTITNLYLPQALKQQDSATINNIPPRNFTINKYRKSFNLFNFHSWRPTYTDPEFSYTLYGQNILNTFETEIGYTYNRNESSQKLEVNAAYGGWFVQPKLGVSQTWNRSINYNRDTTLFFNEKNASFGLSLPLNLSGGNQYRYLTFSSSINTKQLRLTGLGKSFFTDKDFNFLQNRIVFSSQVQKAVQHIYPHWAQTLLVQYRNIINKYSAHQFLANGTVYLPGLQASHSIVINAAYAKRDTMNQYLFTNNFPFSRGYTAVDFPRMWRFGANYHFPLSYPDFGIANLVYFNRVRANSFYDYTQTKSLRTGKNYFFSTVGTEVFFDTKWWNQQPITFGVRYSRLLDKEFRGVTEPNRWEIILPVNLF